jgi:hypothetical protein
MLSHFLCFPAVLKSIDASQKKRHNGYSHAEPNECLGVELHCHGPTVCSFHAVLLVSVYPTRAEGTHMLPFTVPQEF